MKGVIAYFTCPRCGEELEHVNTSRIIARSEGSVIMKCNGCLWQWQLRVVLAQFHDHVDPAEERRNRSVAACGTESGHSKHRREKTPICEECREAHNEANKIRARKTPSATR
jgi:hypothetical protein